MVLCSRSPPCSWALSPRPHFPIQVVVRERRDYCRIAATLRPAASEWAMSKTPYVNPTSEHALFLVLFVTNAGGW